MRLLMFAESVQAKCGQKNPHWSAVSDCVTNKDLRPSPAGGCGSFRPK